MPTNSGRRPADRTAGWWTSVGWATRSAGSDERVVAVPQHQPAQAGHDGAGHVTRQGPVAGSLETLGYNVSCLCDPDVLTLGFARRFTEYKRCNLLLHDPARAESILCAGGGNGATVIAGKAHPATRRARQ